MALEQLLSTLRLLESGSYEGNYAYVGKREGGLQPRGAYGIPKEHWPAWAQRAGIPGADWRDPYAQDRVAAHRADEYLDAFGNYELAAAAWIGGTNSAYKLIQGGYEGPSSIRNTRIREYVENARKSFDAAPDFGKVRRALPQYARKQNQRVSAQGGWVMPVAGPNEFTRGSWMPNSITHRGRTHAATDIYAEEGTPIVAPVNGKVISTKTSKIGGHTARVLGDDGIVYYFAHMAEAAVVGAGQRLLAGNHIGYVGRSGSAQNTKPHLHFSMKKGGQAINPHGYLSGAGSSAKFAPNAQAFGSAGASPNMPGQLNDMLNQ